MVRKKLKKFECPDGKKRNRWILKFLLLLITIIVTLIVPMHYQGCLYIVIDIVIDYFN